MFDPPPELHERFETAVENVRSTFGQSYGHYIDGADVTTDERSAKMNSCG